MAYMFLNNQIDSGFMAEYRHRGVNVLFLDAHARFFPEGSFPKDNTVSFGGQPPTSNPAFWGDENK